MDWTAAIGIDSGVRGGKPVIRGTRLAVEFIVGLLAQGWTIEQLLENYPGITRDQVLACLDGGGAIAVECRPGGGFSCCQTRDRLVSRPARIRADPRRNP